MRHAGPFPRRRRSPSRRDDTRRDRRGRGRPCARRLRQAIDLTTNDTVGFRHRPQYFRARMPISKRREQGEALADIGRSYNVNPAMISRLMTSTISWIDLRQRREPCHWK
jgi:hypothetical protein